MPTIRNPDYERDIRDSFARQGALTAIGTVMARLSPGKCLLRLPFSERVGQQLGYFHGGMVGAVSDSAGGYACMTLNAPGSEVLMVEYKINFVAPASGAEVVALGQVVRPGKSISVSTVTAAVTPEAATDKQLAKWFAEGLEDQPDLTVCAISQHTVFNLPPGQ